MAPTAATASPQTVGHILPHKYSRSGASTPSRSLRPVHGRGFSVQLTGYAGHLPGDDLEQSRLDTQHQAIKLNLGELFTCPELVRAALAPRDDRRPAILDVGTGSGAWYGFGQTARFGRTLIKEYFFVYKQGGRHVERVPTLRRRWHGPC